jgi:hypothetical protein
MDIHRYLEMARDLGQQAEDHGSIPWTHREIASAFQNLLAFTIIAIEANKAKQEDK